MKKRYWFVYLVLLIATRLFSFARHPELVSGSFLYPTPQPEIGICVECAYAKAEVSSEVHHLDGSEEPRVVDLVPLLKPLQPIVVTYSVMLGDKVISQNRKAIPFFLIGPSSHHFGKIGEQVFVRGSLGRSSNFFYRYFSTLCPDYVVDTKWQYTSLPKKAPRNNVNDPQISEESLCVPATQPGIKICLECTYEKIEGLYEKRYSDGHKEILKAPFVILRPLQQPIIAAYSIMAGDKVISQNQKTIPFFLIEGCHYVDDFHPWRFDSPLLGTRVFVEGSLSPSNDLFFFDIPAIDLDYIVDSKWKDEPCETLYYDAQEVTLEGKLYAETNPGPPEYTSIENGDAHETSWILELVKPVHVKNFDESKRDDFHEPEKYIEEVVIVAPDGCSRSVLNKKVRVKGSLFHAHTGHHARRVLCDAKTIRIVEK